MRWIRGPGRGDCVCRDMILTDDACRNVIEGGYRRKNEKKGMR